MTEGQFLTRRELREAERKGKLVPAQSTPVTVADSVAINETKETSANESSAEQATSNLFLSRRQLREFEKRGVIPSNAPASPIVEKVPSATEIDNHPAAEFDEVLAEAEEPITSGIQLFAVSPNLNIEPQTASIVIVPENPLANLSLHITETGEMLKTGSIELPNLSTNTGEISTILDSNQVDEAISQDSITGYVSTIAPVKARGVANTTGKIGIMPSRLARGESQIFAVLSVSLLLVAVGGLLLAAYMLGLL